MKFIQVTTTIYDKEQAEKIAEVLLTKKLAGCVQIIGQVESKFWWDGKIANDKEWLILIKTTQNLYTKVETEIKKNHSYKIPEILGVEIMNGNKDYLNWLEKVTNK